MEPKYELQRDGKLRITVEIDLNGSSLLEKEEEIQRAVNLVGGLATQIALEGYDVESKSVVLGAEKYSLKGREKKNMKRLTVK